MHVDHTSMVPLPYRIMQRHRETHDSVTLCLAPVNVPLPEFTPGQFTMLYVHGIGEIPVSISGGSYPEKSLRLDGTITHTIRDVGAVSHALCAALPGTVLGVRGPFGTGWDLPIAAGKDVLVIAGGVGLAPLRPVVLAALARRKQHRSLTLIVGARTPQEFLFRNELTQWSAHRDFVVEMTIDRPAEDWTGQVGFVTEPLGRIPLNSSDTVAFICGPEPMMRFCASMLLQRGVPAEQIRVSLERNMKCGVGLCGHCQLGPLLVCRDGPVVDYRRAQDLLAVREL